MPIHFRSGELQQKGKGIGGFFRGLINLFHPMVKSAGKNIVKAATSNTAKSIAKTLGEQALDSSLNITKDILQGNDLNQSLQREKRKFKRKGGDIISELQSARKKQKMSKAPKKVSLSSMKKYDR